VWIECARRLIENKHLGPVGQGPRDAHSLLLARPTRRRRAADDSSRNRSPQAPDDGVDSRQARGLLDGGVIDVAIRATVVDNGGMQQARGSWDTYAIAGVPVLARVLVSGRP